MTSKEPSKFSNNIDELSPCLNTLDDSIKGATEAMQFLFNNPKAKMTDRVSKLHKVKMELVSMYCTNSMFWVYLKTQGVNVTEHPITKELDRVKALLRRLKEIEDKKLAPKINTDASKRVMRNALWTAAQKRKPDDKTGEADAAGSDTRYEITDRITGEMTAVSKETSTTADSSVIKAEKFIPKQPAKQTSGGPSKKKKKKY